MPTPTTLTPVTNGSYTQNYFSGLDLPECMKVEIEIFNATQPRDNILGNSVQEIQMLTFLKPGSIISLLAKGIPICRLLRINRT